MRTVSRIFLYACGALLLLGFLSSLLSIAITWFITLFNVGFNIVLVVLLETGASPDILNGLLQFATFTDPIKFLLALLGLIGTEEMTNSAMSVYFIVESIIGLIGATISTVTMVIPLIVTLVGMIICFTGARKKAKKGSHIFIIILGVLTYMYVNTLYGILMILGGVFGVIADSKDAKKLEEARRRKNIKALPYYKTA